MASTEAARRQRFFSPPQEIDISQLLHDAQSRWLKPVEVCEILQNHQKFRLSPDPPLKPPSGSLFLFDRKALRYFRKDGHNWRKKKDGKTVREAHERLKVGSKDVLHCYYAHGEDNPNFQRRSYWMLEGALEHIVLVHYREVTEGTKVGFPRALVHTQNSSYASSPSSMLSCLASSPSDVPSYSLNQDNDETESGEELDNRSTCRLSNCESPLIEQFAEDFDVDTITASLRQSQGQLSNAGLSSFATLGRPVNSILRNSNGTSPNQALMSSMQPVQYEVPMKLVDDLQKAENFDGNLEVFEITDINELLQNPGLLRGPGKLSSEKLNLSTWNALLDSTDDVVEDKFCNWKDLLDQLSLPLTEGTSDITGPKYEEGKGTNGNMLTREDTTCSQQGFLEGLSPRSLGREPQSILEAHLHAVTQPNALHKTVAQDQQCYKPWTLDSGQNKNHDLVVAEPKPSCWDPILKQDEKLDQVQSLLSSEQKNLIRDSQQWTMMLYQTENEQEKWQGQVLSEQYEEALVDENANLVGVPDVGNSPLLQDASEASCVHYNVTTVHENFKKQDSFRRHLAKQMGRDQTPLLTGGPSSPSYWETFVYKAADNSSLPQQMQSHAGSVSSLSQRLIFRIIDFSPEWAYCSVGTKVIVVGSFLDNINIPSDYQWSCMFGEVEVLAEVLQVGVLRCRALPHAIGRVSFCVTCNDRVACSEVREFEYRADPINPIDSTCPDRIPAYDEEEKEEEMLLQIRFSLMLSGSEVSSGADVGNRVCSLSVDDEWMQIETLVKGKGPPFVDAREKIIETLLKQKLQQWIFCKAQDEYRSDLLLDEHGHGVLHMASALGYEWAIFPILEAGVGINFRDSRGWTALHWAAYCGREKVVVRLLAVGAAAGALTDPTRMFPTGRTAADLAARRGHRGIAGYLAEASLTNHLSSLKFSESEMNRVSAAVAGSKAVEILSEKCIITPSAGATEDQLSLKDSLAAVRNATQARVSIHAAFRADSFILRQQKMDAEVGEFGMLQGEVQAIAAAHMVDTSQGFHVKPDLAATQIQCKFRGWKRRKEFLSLRQHVVKIQAHVRGHQARKKYQKLLWSVNFLDKAILRWRRKGQGLRGLHSEATENRVREEEIDDEDFFKQFRRQKEEGFEEELSHVQVMLQSPEARHQYRRMLWDFKRAKEVQSDGNSTFVDDCMCLLD